MAYGGEVATDNLSTRVDLAISLSNIPRLDTLSKSDPMVIVYLKEALKNEPFHEIGRTEQQKNNHNPKFTVTIPIKYLFEEVQSLRFLVVDVDNPKAHITEFSGGKDTIGYVEATMGDIMGSRGSTIDKPIINKEHPNRENGRLRVSGFEVSGGSSMIKFKLAAANLDKKDFLGKSDPYVVIHRGDPSGTNFTPVHKTEFIKQNLNPVWNEFSINSGLLCGNDYNLPLMFECWDWDKDGGHDLIGIFKTNMNELKTRKEYDLVEPKIAAKKKGYKNSGVLQIREISEFKMPTFLDYVTGGTEISLVVGIDFTGSNGDPSTPSSLHFRNPTGMPNEYQSAIRVVGDVVAPYDNDHQFPVYGFGGFLTHKSITSHCFSLTGDEANPFCFGIDGVLSAYNNSFNWLTLSGPTNFAPIIDNVCNMAAQNRGGDKYHILLMMTDGIITDMNATLNVLKKASDLPISIIIVGVGAADFDNMNILDDDDNKLGLARDVVQFVPYREYKNTTIAKLAKDTLAEVPKALVSYMMQHGIQPRPRVVYQEPVIQNPPPVHQ